MIHCHYLFFSACIPRALFGGLKQYKRSVSSLSQPSVSCFLCSSCGHFMRKRRSFHLFGESKQATPTFISSTKTTTEHLIKDRSEPLEEARSRFFPPLIFLTVSYVTDYTLAWSHYVPIPYKHQYLLLFKQTSYIFCKQHLLLGFLFIYLFTTKWKIPQECFTCERVQLLWRKLIVF